MSSTGVRSWLKKNFGTLTPTFNAGGRSQTKLIGTRKVYRTVKVSDIKRHTYCNAELWANQHGYVEVRITGSGYRRSATGAGSGWYDATWTGQYRKSEWLAHQDQLKTIQTR